MFFINAQYINHDKVNELNLEIDEYKDLQFLCINETAVNVDYLKSIVFCGFCLASCYCRSSTTGGGVAIWAGQNLTTGCLALERYCVEGHVEMCWNIVQG